MRSNVGFIFNFNNNSTINKDETQSHEIALFMQNQRDADCWCPNTLSSTVVNIIERHEQINERLQATSIADILAGIQFDSKRNENASLNEENRDQDGVSDIEQTITETPIPHPHLQPGNNKITNALYEDKKERGNVWKNKPVLYNNPFDPRITFKGLQRQQTTKFQNISDAERLIGYPDTFNSFLDIVNPSGFANSYLHTYRQFLRDLRNDSQQLAKTDPFKIPTLKKDESRFFDKLESGLRTTEEKVHDVPCYVGNECENIDMWSQITAVRGIWMEDDQRGQSPNLNDDCSTKSVLVALFSKSTEDLHSNSSKQAGNKQGVSERPEINRKHLLTETVEEAAEKAVQSRILPYLLSVHHNNSDSKASADIQIEQQGDAGPDQYNIDKSNKIIALEELDESLAGQENVQTHNMEPGETFWAPTEAGDFITNQGTSFVPPFNPWSTVHVEYLDRPVVAAQTSMFWSHQQRQQQQQQQKQQQQQNQQEHHSQQDQEVYDQAAQESYKQQQNQHMSLKEQPQRPDSHLQKQQNQQYQVQELYYHHNQQDDFPLQQQHQHQQQQMFQNQYAEQQKPLQQTQYQQQQYGQQTQQQHVEQQNMHLYPPPMHKQQRAQSQHLKQQRLQNSYQQTHQYRVHPTHQMPPVQQQQQQNSQLQIQFNPNHVLFQPQYGNTQVPGNKMNHGSISRQQWSGMQQNYGQASVPDRYTYTNGSQHSANVPQPQHYAQTSGRPVYQNNDYYSGVYSQYQTTNSLNGCQRSNYQQLNGNQAYHQPAGSMANAQVMNLNFIHERPQHNNVQFDDEVWYINGIPHQHAKPVQPNENVELAPNQQYWPHPYSHPNTVPPSNINAQQSYQSSCKMDSGGNVRGNNQQKFYDHNQVESMAHNPNNSNNNNNNAEVGETLDDYSKETCALTELDVCSETCSTDSVPSSRSEQSLFKLADDMTENSRESCESETPDTWSEFSDTDEEEWFDADAPQCDLVIEETNLVIEEKNNDFEDENVNESLSSCKMKKSEDFVGRQIKVVSGRSKANRERQYQRKSRTNRTSHLIQII